MQRQYDSHDNGERLPTTLLAIITVVLVVVIAMVLILAYFSPNYGYYGYGWGGGMMGGWMGFPMLFMLPIGLIILIVVAYVVFRGVWWGLGCCGGHYGYCGHYRSDEERETAMEILRRRYANGEISKEQFEQMKKDIVG
jgi:putative membrane protein